MSDLISREMVRQLICRNNDKYGYSDRFHEFTEECLKLPSVNPSTDLTITDGGSSTDCISREEAIREIDKEKPNLGSHREIADDMIENIKALPSVEPEKCGDCISRQAARNALLNKGQRSKRYKLGETWELNLMEIEEALWKLPSIEPERKTGKWIPVEKELPELEKDVLVSLKGGRMFVAALFPGSEGHEHWWIGEEEIHFAFNEVDGWMSLPEPYRTIARFEPTGKFHKCRCSACKTEFEEEMFYDNPVFKFCPNCAARMEVDR